LNESVFLVSVFAVALLSGGTAAVAGFGIGSLLTPLIALELDMSTAVAAVAIPHAAATTVRFWRLRRSVDWSVIQRFGLLSAAGGLIGALLHARVSARALTMVLGVLLIATSLSTVANRRQGWSPGATSVGLLGLLSGLFGGLAGNQGGLRAAALTSFRMAPVVFVATATATALLVDLARTPIYLWHAGPRLLSLWAPLSVATAGVLVGTLAGERILLGLSPAQFRRVLGVLIGLLGVWILVRA
jgi:uncharacterized protein